MYKLVFFVPVTHADSVKNAVFKAGAGRIGNYDSCCWQVLGEGQFRPQKGSDPFIGAENRLETVQEYRVELVCDDQHLEAAVKAMKQAHPYEEPAYDVWPLTEI